MNVPFRNFRSLHCIVEELQHVAGLLYQEYPLDPLRKISALQTKVELAGNRRNKQNLAENLAYKELASWKNFLVYKLLTLWFYKSVLAGNYVPDAITVK